MQDEVRSYADWLLCNRINPLTPWLNLYFSLLSTIQFLCSENLVLDQPIIHKVIFFFILITYLIDIVMII